MAVFDDRSRNWASWTNATYGVPWADRWSDIVEDEEQKEEDGMNSYMSGHPVAIPAPHPAPDIIPPALGDLDPLAVIDNLIDGTEHADTNLAEDDGDAPFVIDDSGLDSTPALGNVESEEMAASSELEGPLEVAAIATHASLTSAVAPGVAQPAAMAAEAAPASLTMAEALAAQSPMAAMLDMPPAAILDMPPLAMLDVPPVAMLDKPPAAVLDMPPLAMLDVPPLAMPDMPPVYQYVSGLATDQPSIPPEDMDVVLPEQPAETEHEEEMPVALLPSQLEAASSDTLLPSHPEAASSNTLLPSQLEAASSDTLLVRDAALGEGPALDAAPSHAALQKPAAMQEELDDDAGPQQAKERAVESSPPAAVEGAIVHRPKVNHARLLLVRALRTLLRPVDMLVAARTAGAPGAIAVPV